jgi:hypothetical protein
MGVRFPLPAPSIILIFNHLRGIEPDSQIVSGTKSGTVRILPVFNRLWILHIQSVTTAYIQLVSITLEYGIRSG